MLESSITRRAFLSLASIVLPFGVQGSAADIQDVRITRFRAVNEHVYRGGQPTPEELRQLAKFGIKTVIDLRGPGEERNAEKRLVEELGMRYINLPMKGLQTPSDEIVHRALELLGTGGSEGWPVFVHCKYGKDRTGVVIACYRITNDRWPNEKALAEAREIGLSMWERAFQHYILSFAPAAKTAAAQPPVPGTTLPTK